MTLTNKEINEIYNLILELEDSDAHKFGEIPISDLFEDWISKNGRIVKLNRQ